MMRELHFTCVDSKCKSPLKSISATAFTLYLLDNILAMNDNLKGINYLFRYRKLFLFAIVIGGILGVGVTFFIPKKYLSTAIVYPYNSHTNDQLVSNPQFGFEIETEQLLQLLSSKTMRDRTIEKFKLYDYYDLDTTDPAWNAELTLRYVKDINFLRSKYLSVVINVTMENPELAAEVANFQVDEINRYRTAIFEENRRTYFDYVNEQLTNAKNEVEQLRDSIYDLKGGDQMLLFNFVENLNNENYDPSDFINLPALESVITEYRSAYGRYTSLEEQFASLKREYEKPIPSVYSIDKATPTYKKVSPSFLINGLLGALLMFVLVFTGRYTLDKWRGLKSTVDA